MENKICVYAISKNEEQFVDRWADSMLEADAVVVLDTGSTDNTVEKLNAKGIIVKVEKIDPWRFDTARNHSLDMVPDDCNILVCTDLDEVFEPGWAQPLRDNWIEGKHCRATYRYAWSHLPNGEEGRVFRYDKIHSRNWHWTAPVHEMLVDNDNNSNKYLHANTCDLFDTIHLHHYPDKTKSRSSYLPLLEKRKEEMPNDHYGLIYLAHEYYYRGYYDKAIEQLKEVLERFPNNLNSVETASCYLFIGDSFLALADQISDEQDVVHAIDYYKLAIMKADSYREPYLNIAKAFMKQKNWISAEYYIKRGLEKSYRHYTWLERDTSWSYEPWDLLCLTAYYSGNYNSSAIYASKALTYEPTNSRLLKNLQLCLNKLDSVIGLRLI